MIQDFRDTCVLEPSVVREFMGGKGMKAELYGLINMNVAGEQLDDEIKRASDIIICGLSGSVGCFIITPGYLSTCFDVSESHADECLHRLQKGELEIDSSGKFLATLKEWLLESKE